MSIVVFAEHRIQDPEAAEQQQVRSTFQTGKVFNAPLKNEGKDDNTTNSPLHAYYRLAFVHVQGATAENA